MIKTRNITMLVVTMLAIVLAIVLASGGCGIKRSVMEATPKWSVKAQYLNYAKRSTEALERIADQLDRKGVEVVE